MKTHQFMFIIFLLIGVESFGQTSLNGKCSVIQPSSTERFEKWIRNMRFSSVRKEDELLKVPVVVHILHPGDQLGEGFNIADERVQSQLRILNEDFNRLEGTNGFNSHPNGASAGVEFRLAQTDPNGNLTNGIVRVDITQQEQPPFQGSMLAFGAYHSIWDPYQYLNIWVIPGFQDTGLGEARFPKAELPGLEGLDDFKVPGFDQFHGVPVKDIDGVAINTIHFGQSDINSPYNLGRTGTHEIGHFLGLYHTWGNDGFVGSCDIDDFCEDTPNVASRTSGCPVDNKACDGSKAMIENYMDYTDDACMNIFTKDQVSRMRVVLENSPRRKSLLNSKGLYPPDDITDIEDQNKTVLSVYPNPITDRLTIDSSTKLKTMKLLDVKGSAVWVGEMDQKKVTIDLSYLDCGVYFFSFIDHKGLKQIIRLMKE